MVKKKGCGCSGNKKIGLTLASNARRAAEASAMGGVALVNASNTLTSIKAQTARKFIQKATWIRSLRKVADGLEKEDAPRANMLRELASSFEGMSLSAMDRNVTKAHEALLAASFVMPDFYSA